MSLIGDWKLVDTRDFDLDLSGSISTDFDGNYIFKGSTVMSFDKNIKVKFNPIYNTDKGFKILAGLELVF